MKEIHIALIIWRDNKEIDLSFANIGRTNPFINHRDRATAVHSLFKLLTQLIIYKDKF